MTFWHIIDFVFHKPCILEYNKRSHARLQNDKSITHEEEYQQNGSGNIVFLLERVIIAQIAISYTNSRGKSYCFCYNEYCKGKQGVLMPGLMELNEFD